MAEDKWDFKSRIKEQLNAKELDRAVSALNRRIRFEQRALADKKQAAVWAWPYERLAALYRKQKEFDKEAEILKQFIADYPDCDSAKLPDVTKSEEEKFQDNAVMRLERRELFGDDGKGSCSLCEQKRVLTKNALGEWLCSKCEKIRKPEIDRRKGIEVLSHYGLNLKPSATQDQIDKLFALHGHLTHYVSDVLEVLTGRRPKSAIAQRSDLGTHLEITFRSEFRTSVDGFEQFVSSFFNDSLVRRLAAEQKRRDEVAISRMSPEERNDSMRYQFLGRYKPPIEQGRDFEFVATKLRDRYAEPFEDPNVRRPNRG